MTEDDRIRKIRAVLDAYYDAESNTREVDVVARVSRIVESALPAPRVFFPDDEVPSGVRVMAEDGRVYPEPQEYGDGIGWSANFTTVEVMSPQEWKATVDLATAARADSEWQDTEGASP